MANKEYYFRGIANWAKVRTPDEKFESYTLDLHLDDESFKMFKDSGLQLKVRDNDKDGEFIKLRRAISRKTKSGVVDLGPPKVLLKTEAGEYEPFDGLIGNGSEVVCKVRVYDTSRGKGHELVLVAIEKLVPYDETEKVGGEDFPF